MTTLERYSNDLAIHLILVFTVHYNTILAFSIHYKTIMFGLLPSLTPKKPKTKSTIHYRFANLSDKPTTATKI
jgi:hypothetical protein